jgi:hypothetical protein
MMKSASAPNLFGTAGRHSIHADLEVCSFDTKLTSKIMKKREEEMKRRQKLLNPRSFKFGVPHDSLDAQVMERRALAEDDFKEEEHYSKSTRLQEQVLQACENIKAAASRERKKETVAYSLENLRKEQRREYHLSDPMELKKERILTEEEMAAYGPSSMMLGERAEDALRKKKEKQLATRAWLKEQMQEKQARAAEELAADRKYDEEMLFANQVRGVCEKQAKIDAREDKIQEVLDNQEIALQHRQRREAKLNKNIAINEQHVTNLMNDDRLTEKHDYMIGSNMKIMKGEYRRLSQGEKQDVWNTNAAIILDKQARKRAEQEEAKEDAKDIKTAQEVLGVVEEEKRRVPKERRIRAEEHNRTLAAYKQANDIAERRKYLSFEQRD